MLKKGIFITFEGIEGSGKSTQAQKIYKYFKKEKFKTILIQEPGGTKIGNKIREILLDYKNKRITYITELFLYLASRNQLVQEIIKPYLSKKYLIICDRFYHATFAYQGYGRKLSLNLIKKLNDLVLERVKPDLTLILDVKPKIGLNRVLKGRKRDRIERENLSFHSRVRKGYICVAQDNFKVILINGEKSIDEVYKIAKEKITNLIKKNLLNFKK